MSLTFVEEELGVAALELLGDLESPAAVVVEAERGEAVPEFESFFFDDLLESFARDSCSCWKLVSWSVRFEEWEAGVIVNVQTGVGTASRSDGVVHTTLCLKPFISTETPGGVSSPVEEGMSQRETPPCRPEQRDVHLIAFDSK